LYSLFKICSREPRNEVQLQRILCTPPINRSSLTSSSSLAVISEWRVDGLTVTTSKITYAILCIACFEEKGLLIAILRPVDPIHIGQSESRRCSATNRNSARDGKCYPGLSLFVVFKAQIRPSSGQSPGPMVSQCTHYILRTCLVFSECSSLKNWVAPFGDESLGINNTMGITTVTNGQMMERPVGQQAPVCAHVLRSYMPR
jgi:hypothetical protein